MNLNQITIPSQDLERSISFYETLGLQLIVDSRPRYARFMCPDGGSSFSLQYTEHLAQGDGVHIYFECQDLDSKVAHLQQQGIDFLSGPEDQRWLWREAHLTDPDNNHLILYWAGENRLNPPWRI
ncbi:MAG: VOC family protein [Bacteroidota bacterium]